MRNMGFAVYPGKSRCSPSLWGESQPFLVLPEHQQEAQSCTKAAKGPKKQKELHFFPVTDFPGKL